MSNSRRGFHRLFAVYFILAERSPRVSKYAFIGVGRDERGNAVILHVDFKAAQVRVALP